MRFLRKINRGAIVLTALFLCVVIGVAFVAVSRNKRLAEAEAVVNAFMNEASRLYEDFEKSSGNDGEKQPESKDFIGEFEDSIGGDKGDSYIEGYEEFETFAKDKTSAFFSKDASNAEAIKYLYEGGYLKYWDYNVYSEAEKDSIEFYKDGGISFTYQVYQKRPAQDFGGYSWYYGSVIIVMEKTERGYVISKAGSTDGSIIQEYYK